MIRDKPLENIDVLGPLNVDLSKVLGFYHESSNLNKLYIKPPSHGQPGADTIDLLAFQNDKEHRKMLQAQCLLREHTQRQEQINKLYVEDSRKMIQRLRKTAMRTNAFLKDCEEKKVIANGTILNQQHLQNELKATIASTTKGVRVLTSFKNKLLRVVKEMEPYEKVLQDVLKLPNNHYTSVKDCMDRCDALILTNVEVLKMQKEKFIEIQNRRAMLVKLCEAAMLDVLKYMTELGEMIRDYDNANNECQMWEKLLVEIKDTLSEHELNVHLMTTGIFAIVKTLCTRRGIFPYQIKEKGRLDFIRSEINIMRNVLALCEQEEAHRRRHK